MLLHDREETDNDLGRRSDEDLSLSSLLCVADVVEAVGLGAPSAQMPKMGENERTRTETRMLA